MSVSDYPGIATQYCRDVLSNKISACKEVHEACQRQLDDLAKQDDDSFAFRFDPKLATKICFFVEQAPHIKGPLRGRRIKLEPWQIFILSTVFGWVNKD